MASLPLFDRPDAPVPLWSVSELTGLVREILETGFADVGLRGEVANLSRPRSGHVYFSLKDDSAQIRAVVEFERQVREGARWVRTRKGGIADVALTQYAEHQGWPVMVQPGRDEETGCLQASPGIHSVAS